MQNLLSWRGASARLIRAAAPTQASLYVASNKRLPNVEVSLGYRADVNFRAMAGSVSFFKSADRGFFAANNNISVGVGG